jgi:hypothetical protein
MDHTSCARIPFHTTPAANLPSILREGVHPRSSRGAREECWLTTAALRPWAADHTRRRHRTSEVVCLRLLVPAGALVRRGRGVYTCPERISPDCIQAVGIAELLHREGAA